MFGQRRRRLLFRPSGAGTSAGSSIPDNIAVNAAGTGSFVVPADFVGTMTLRAWGSGGDGGQSGGGDGGNFSESTVAAVAGTWTYSVDDHGAAYLSGRGSWIKNPSGTKIVEAFSGPNDCGLQPQGGTGTTRHLGAQGDAVDGTACGGGVAGTTGDAINGDYHAGPGMTGSEGQGGQDALHPNGIAPGGGGFSDGGTMGAGGDGRITVEFIAA